MKFTLTDLKKKSIRRAVEDSLNYMIDNDDFYGFILIDYSKLEISIHKTEEGLEDTKTTRWCDINAESGNHKNEVVVNTDYLYDFKP